MNLYVLSDVTFDLVLYQIKQHSEYTINDYNYSEDIVASLLSLHHRLEHIDLLIIHFDSYFRKYKKEQILEIIEQIETAAKIIKGNILLSNSFFNGLGNTDTKKNIGQNDQLPFEIHENLNSLIEHNNVYCYDFKKLLFDIGLQRSYNFNTGFLYQMPYTKELIKRLAAEIKNHIHFLNSPEKKAIFIDCDNTLWRGIVGEDGLNKIQCNKNADGIIFYHFQEFLQQKKKDGFILGLCSKNNESDVLEAFETLNMPLKWDDFVIKKINWNNKSENLKEAAKELNIRLSSFIFIDDSEFEIQSVNTIIPEVKTIHFTDNYMDFLSLCDDFSFKKKFITNEDLSKTKQYQAEGLRENEKEQAASFEEYIKKLNIKIDVLINNEINLERLSQLTEKTNQFNFNKKTFTVSQLKQFINAGNLVYELKVSDKFGDYGIVGLILIETKGNNDAVLMNYIISCRALGRNIEHQFFDFVLNDLQQRKIKLTEIVFVENERNIPARLFFDQIRL